MAISLILHGMLKRKEFNVITSVATQFKPCVDLAQILWLAYNCCRDRPDLYLHDRCSSVS